VDELVLARTPTQAVVARRAEANLAAVTARSTAVLAAERCRSEAPDADWLLATPRRLPPVPVGEPARPLILALAALATANAAVALALELVASRGDAAALDLTLVAAHRTAIAAREGIYTLESRGARKQRHLLAHTTAQATHAAAEALTTYALATKSPRFGHSPRPEYAFPRAWSRSVDGLEMRLFGESQATGDEVHDRESLAAAEAACDAAMHALQACSLRFPRLGACSAAHRVARAACLASTFVGWAALEDEH